MKQNKLVFSNELAYVVGLLILGIGTALMEAADFGVSMVIAPAYILHLKVSEHLPFFSFGMAGYTLQAVLLIITAVIMGRFKLGYLFSFITAVLYGSLLDGCIFLVSFLGIEGTVMRLVAYFVGLILGGIGLSFCFRTYISPEAYEVFVKEISQRFGLNLHKFKTCYDCASCLFSILLSFAFFGLWHFEGVKWGTVVCALVNGLIIGQCSKLQNRFLQFEDKLPLRRFFEK